MDLCRWVNEPIAVSDDCLIVDFVADLPLSRAQASGHNVAGNTMKPLLLKAFLPTAIEITDCLVYCFFFSLVPLPPLFNFFGSLFAGFKADSKPSILHSQ